MRCRTRDEHADRMGRREGIAATLLRPCKGLPLGVLALITFSVAGPRPGQAQAQAVLNAEYLVSLSGLPIGKGRATVDISEDRYSITASGATAGLMRLFSSGHGSGTVKGTMAGGVPTTAQFNASITSAKKTEEYRLTITGGEVTDFSVTPPLPPQSDRVPLNDAHRRGVNDPMSATLIRVPGNGNPVGPEACRRTLSVFDGRMRYDVQLAYKRSEMIHADGYSGPAVVCMVTFVPIAGHNPERPAVRYLVRLREMEAWLVPIAGTRVVVPARVVIPTPFGLGVMQAVKFDAVAQRPTAKAKAP